MKALLSYLELEAWPRRRRIVGRSHAAASVLVTLGIVLFGQHLALADLATDKLVTAVFAYTALALGACLTGLTVTLTLPDRSFAQYLVEAKRSDLPDANAYSDLVFVFSWTAVAHWAVIGLSLVTILVVGDHNLPTFRPDCSGSALLVALLLGLLVYAIAQFLVTILTLSSVAAVYLDWLRKKSEGG